MLKANDRVYVKNTTPSGEIIIEGEARIISPIENRKDWYVVEFYSDIGYEYDRFIEENSKIKGE